MGNGDEYHEDYIQSTPTSSIPSSIIKNHDDTTITKTATRPVSKKRKEEENDENISTTSSQVSTKISPITSPKKIAKKMENATTSKSTETPEKLSGFREPELMKNEVHKRIVGYSYIDDTGNKVYVDPITISRVIILDSKPNPSPKIPRGKLYKLVLQMEKNPTILFEDWVQSNVFSKFKIWCNNCRI